MSSSTTPELPPPPENRRGWPWHNPENGSGADQTDAQLAPMVTVVTPSFNQGQFIEESIRSVLFQGYSNLEYMIADGGSTDDTRAIIQKYDAHFSNWYSQSDGGQAAGINWAWEKSNGEFVTWLNSDDLLAPRSLQRAVKFLVDRPEIDVVYGDLAVIDGDGKFVTIQRYQEFDFHRMLCTPAWISQPGSLIRRRVLEKIGLLNESLHMRMDTDFWIRVAGTGMLAHYPDVLAQYRMHERAKTAALLPQAAVEFLEIYERLLKAPISDEFLRRYENQARAASHLHAADCFRSCGRSGEARAHAIKAIKLDPGRAATISGFYQLATSMLGLTKSSLSIWRGLAGKQSS